MRMTIEQDIKVIRKMLACTDLRARENLHADMVDACEDAISTMRKYQKIKNIICKWEDGLYDDEGVSHVEILDMISNEVNGDGNVD